MKMKICSKQYGREAVQAYVKTLQEKDKTLIIQETHEGFQINSPSFSDTIQIACWETFGWNEFLLHSKGIWHEDPTIHELYISIETFLYQLNEIFYDFPVEQKHLLFSQFEEAVRLMETWKKDHPFLITKCRTKTIGTFQVEIEMEQPFERLVLFFSRPMNRWFVNVYPVDDSATHAVMEQWIQEWREKCIEWNKEIAVFPTPS